MRFIILAFSSLLFVCTNSYAGGYLPKISVAGGVFDMNPHPNNLSTIVYQDWQHLGDSSLAGSKVRVFAKSDTTVSSAGKPNIAETGFFNADADNQFFNRALNCRGLDVIRLSTKDVDAEGQSSVSLEFRFTEAPIKNLQLLILDVDEAKNGIVERVIVNAYDNLRASVNDKIDPKKWDILGMGDLSLTKTASPNNPTEVTLPPYWYTIGNGTNSFGLLQARKKSNQNRDYTVLQMPDAIKRLRVKFKGAYGEKINAAGQQVIGSHVYVALWHDDQKCRN